MHTNSPGLLPPAGLACAATATHRARPEDSQDAAAVISLPNGYRALALADGLGSFAFAGEAARFVVGAAQHLLEGTPGGKNRLGNPGSLFARVQQQLAAFAQDQAPSPEPGRNATPGREVDPARSWGTTLLLAEETPGLLLCAYAGNGGLFHLRGDFLDCGTDHALPWNAINYLSPHSVSEQGREALTRYLAARVEPGQTDPTVLGLCKDARLGDLLLLCTDGIFSQDQVRHGDPGDGSCWGEVSPPLIAVHQALRACWRAEGDLTAAALQQALSACLADLRARRLLEDDATLGLLVTHQALAYRRERQEAPHG